MKAIETVAEIGSDGVLHLDIPTGLDPGTHAVTLLVSESATTEPARPAARALRLPDPIDLGPWPADMTFGREEIYGEDGE
jgi:hypothetical protein